MANLIHRNLFLFFFRFQLNRLLLGMGEKLEKACEMEENLRKTIDEYEKKLGEVAKLDKIENKGIQRKAQSTDNKKGKVSDTLDQVRGRSSPSERRRRGVSAEGEKDDRVKIEHSGFSKIVVALAVCLTAAVLNFYHPEALSADGICAPVMPGTVLYGNTYFTSSSPWWAPDDVKIPAFQFFCGGRRRIHLTVASEKLHLFEEKSGKVKTVQKVNAVSAQINGGEIVVENKKKKGKHVVIAAPWLR